MSVFRAGLLLVLQSNALKAMSHQWQAHANTWNPSNEFQGRQYITITGIPTYGTYLPKRHTYPRGIPNSRIYLPPGYTYLRGIPTHGAYLPLGYTYLWGIPIAYLPGMPTYGAYIPPGHTYLRHIPTEPLLYEEFLLKLTNKRVGTLLYCPCIRIQTF